MHEILIAAFVVITTPVTLMLLSRAALHRDRSESAPTVPAPRQRLTQPQSVPESKV